MPGRKRTQKARGKRVTTLPACPAVSIVPIVNCLGQQRLFLIFVHPMMVGDVQDLQNVHTLSEDRFNPLESMSR
jgi:hypothetical protein